VASAIGFLSSSYLGMFAQTLTLLISAILAFLAILYVEVDTKRKTRGTENVNEETGMASEEKPVENIKAINEINSTIENDVDTGSVEVKE